MGIWLTLIRVRVKVDERVTRAPLVCVTMHLRVRRDVSVQRGEGCRRLGLAQRPLLCSAAIAHEAARLDWSGLGLGLGL